MKTRNLCAGLMLTGISLLAFSCSKQDQNELLDTTSNKVSNPTPAATPTDPADNPNASEDIVWTTTGTSFFAVQVPSDWKLTEMNNMDSYAGLLQGQAGTMNYEYSKRDKPYNIDRNNYSYHYEQVNGKMARIIRSNDGMQYGISIDSAKVMTDGQGNVTKVMGFMLMSKQGTSIDREIATTIIRSLRMKQ